MRSVWVIADAIVSPLGETTEDNFSKLESRVSGLMRVENLELSNTPIWAGWMQSLKESELTRFEEMCMRAIDKITQKYSLPADRTLFILSTTKGNIAKIHQSHSRLSLHATAQHLAEKTGLRFSLVVSNACVSGVMAITVAERFLKRDKFDHALIVGADELTSFVISGFQSLHALSPEMCRPFDVSRKGINLGEAAGALLVSARPEILSATPAAKILGSGLSNDANHISGPSRTGEELASAIDGAIRESEISRNSIDFISAHGTATIYNDEMESKAFSLAGLADTPVNSLKPFYGHTLGAAGVIEVIAGLESLRRNLLLPTLGYETHGVSQPLNVIKKTERTSLRTFLKTASGFGGCNAAIVIQKTN